MNMVILRSLSMCHFDLSPVSRFRLIKAINFLFAVPDSQKIASQLAVD
jgi:hypothetical protein